MRPAMVSQKSNWDKWPQSKDWSSRAYALTPRSLCPGLPHKLLDVCEVLHLATWWRQVGIHDGRDRPGSHPTACGASGRARILGSEGRDPAHKTEACGLSRAAYLHLWHTTYDSM